jgi:hypothetical protein
MRKRPFPNPSQWDLRPITNSSWARNLSETTERTEYTERNGSQLLPHSSAKCSLNRLFVFRDLSIAEVFLCVLPASAGVPSHPIPVSASLSS